MINSTDQLNKVPWVVFDTETTGAYAVGFEVVEFGAVKWINGQVVDELNVLVKPSVPMSQEVIGIHGITNEMVEPLGPMKNQIQRIRDFFSGAVAWAHHAPFDLGFMAWEFEKYQVALPTEPVLCTSLLSRQLIPESGNHRLQTLVKFLNLQQGTAHRATDDAKACLGVAIECLKRAGEEVSLGSLQDIQVKKLNWSDYALLGSGRQVLIDFALAIQRKCDVDFVYEGGSQKTHSRRMTPVGIVRSPDGDYLSAICHIDRIQKRFYIAKIKDYALVLV